MTPYNTSYSELIRAVSSANFTLVERLLRRSKHDVDAVNDKGQTALMIAAIYGQKDIAELLIMAGASIHKQDYQGNSAYRYAKLNCHYHLLRLFEEQASLQPA